MKILLSLNFKFMEYTSLELYNLIKNSNSIKGFEISFDLNKKEEQQYVNELVFICKQHDYILQFHGDSTLTLEEQYKYLDFINDISNELNKRIDIVLHPISGNNFDECVSKTNEYFSNVLNYIYTNSYKINISIENLNTSIPEKIRLSKDYLLPILSNNIDLNFTYDVGHEICEYGNLTDLNPVLLERLTNIHIHTFDPYDDHRPIIKSNLNWVKAIQYLKFINFNNTLVLEYNFYALGDNYDERMINYIECAEYINEYL